MPGHPAPPRALRPVEVQTLLRVGRTTVHDLATAGRLHVVGRTPGGHRRYSADSPAIVEALAAAQPVA